MTPARFPLTLADPSCRDGHAWTRVGAVVPAGRLDGPMVILRTEQTLQVCSRCCVVSFRKEKPIPPEVHFRRADELAPPQLYADLRKEDRDLHPDDEAELPGRHAP